MADQTSTLSLGVRTAQAAEQVKRLKKELVDLAVAAKAVQKTPAAPNPRATTDSTNQSRRSLNELEKSMAQVEAAGSNLQMRYAKSFGAIAGSAKLNTATTVAELHKVSEAMSSSNIAQASAMAKQSDEMVKLHQKALDSQALQQRKATDTLNRQRLEQARAGNLAYARAQEQGRASELAALRADIVERSRLMLEQEKVQQTQQAKALARHESSRRAQLALDDKYNAMNLQQQIRYLEKMERVLNAGSSRSRVARTFGMTALRGLGNLSAMQEAVRAQSSLSKTYQAGSSAIKSNTGMMRENSAVMRDAHSIARGLSGSLGTLWMTYGSLAPLIAGAALGNMARNTYQVGKDLEYRLKFIQALGNEAVSTGQLMPSVLGSMKTPLEAAEAMQAMAQAGLTAQESLKSLNTVVQLSTLGELSMEKASVAVTASLAAFNIEARDASRVGDVFAKAASISNTSVEKIAQSMKQASTNASQYKISIEETSAALAVMAQRNITGTMAGTSFRNMTNELYAPIARGAKALKQLGVSAYDSMGQIRPFQDVLLDLRNAMFDLTDESRNSALEAIFGERGSRAIKPILEDLDTYIGKVKELEGAQGFLAVANAKLIDTVEGASNRLQSTIQQSYGKAFDGVKDSLRELLDNLDRLAASEGFVNMVTGLAKVFVNLAQSVVDSASTLKYLGLVYGAFKVSVITATAANRLWNMALEMGNQSLGRQTMVMRANTAAARENAAAKMQGATSAGVAQTASSMFTRALSIGTKLTSVVGWVTIAYLALSSAYDIATDKAGKMAAVQDKEAKRLRSVADELERQADLQEQAIADQTGGATPEDNRSLSQKLTDDYDAQIAKLEEKSKLLNEEYNQTARITARLYDGEMALSRQSAAAQLLNGNIEQQEEIQRRIIANNEQVLGLERDRARAIEQINRLIDQQKFSRDVLQPADQMVQIYEGMNRLRKEAESVLRTSKDPQKRKTAQYTIELVNKYGSEKDPLDLKQEFFQANSESRKEMEQQALDNRTYVDEKLAQHRKSMTFSGSSSTKPRKDYNDPNYILERVNERAAKTALKQEGEIRKANLAVMRDQHKAQQQIREQYLTDDVIAGLRARDQAENKFNAILDRRMTLIEEIKEAMQNASDPKQIALGQERIQKLNSEMEWIRAAQESAGIKAQGQAQADYLEDNTAHAGVEKLFNTYRNEALKTGDVVANALESSFDKAGQALEEFAITGKLNFRELTVSILQDLSRMAMKMATNQIFSSILGALGGFAGGGGATTGTATAYPVSIGAKGLVFESGSVQKFARGGTFTNGVVDKTHLAPTAMFGEAGPEAIMPLTRSSDGSLGVRASGASGSTPIHMETNVYIQSDGSSNSETKTDSAGQGLLTQMGNEINSMITAKIQRELGQGGLISRAIKAS